MSKIHRFYSIISAALSGLALVLTVAPANALPGQHINTVVNWTKAKAQLPTLKYNSEAHGYDGRKGKLYFYVNVTSQNGTVTKEGITISGDSNVKFTKKNARTVQLIQDIYNSNVANDFSKSRSITKVGRDQFYAGNKFAYIAAEVQGGSAFQIINLSSLQGEIDNARYCQTNQCDL
ncbi:MAG: hypothetical protein KME32_06225 [Mojavia pulchra JT2-VF2]|jgi:hypothetical protein|uniref:Uncharacterized protein n=1 Tax=Mojavia pulchra JT2-VF2 TaxID=287848 RepID=A0A951UF09_9NOST|nr:hypothetical protein [Mojavia pulchra JT2-VF2]